MTKRSKFLIISLATVMVAVALVGWVMAQGSGDQSESSEAPQQSFLSRVAANLSLDEATLREAIAQARLQLIDEAVEQGRITQEQADLMKQEIGGNRWMSWGPQGFCGRPGGPIRGSFGHWGGRGMMAPPQQSPSSP